MILKKQLLFIRNWDLRLHFRRKDIEEVYRYIEAEKMNTTKDTIHFLPFWDNGVRFFTIEGPNKEKVEFSQYL